MANSINAQVTGGIPQTLENMETVNDVRIKLEISEEYQAIVNGEEADMDDTLEDYNHVLFTEKVKGN